MRRVNTKISKIMFDVQTIETRRTTMQIHIQYYSYIVGYMKMMVLEGTFIITIIFENRLRSVVSRKITYMLNHKLRRDKNVISKFIHTHVVHFDQFVMVSMKFTEYHFQSFLLLTVL